MEELVLLLLNQLHGGNPPLRKPADLCALSSAQLLALLDHLPEELLPVVVHILKDAGSGGTLFHKLMGEHEEELRPLVDRFFDRYAAIVMNPPEEKDFNPLLYYLPSDCFDDLALLQSREGFFTSQDIDIINEFLQELFEKPPQFVAGEQHAAWDWFWVEVLKR